MTRTVEVGRFEFDRISLLWAGLFANTFLLLVALYYVLSPNSVYGPTPIVVPLVWLVVGGWALVRLDVPDASRRRRLIAGGVAVGYLGLLAYFGGVVVAGGGPGSPGVRVELFRLPPGWNPAVYVTTPGFHVNLLPYKVVGYLALAGLVYAALLDAAESVIGGVVGLFSCVSCTWPILASVASGFLGGGAVATSTTSPSSLLLSTVVFVVTVGVLHWRPGWD